MTPARQLPFVWGQHGGQATAEDLASVESWLDESSFDVIPDVSPNDVMYTTDPDYYYHWGKQAVRCIARFLLLAGKSEVRSILDFPSGHGRVIRALKAAFPDARLTAGDLDHDGVDFCGRMFGAATVYAQEDPGGIEIGDRFDLIWCGSLLTHVDASRWRGFLELFAHALEPDGLLVFTTHGEIIANTLRRGELEFPLPSIPDLVERFDTDGFAYQDYINQSGYGISLSSAGWVGGLLHRWPELRLQAYIDGGWNGHQDAYACIHR